MFKLLVSASVAGIADEFQDYPEYRIYKIDTNIKERASLSLDDFGDIQGYEEEVDPQELGSSEEVTRRIQSFLL